MNRISPFTRRLPAGMLTGVAAALLSACGGGITSSGGSADTSTDDIVGVYTGQERLTLTRSNDGAVRDTATNQVNVTISGDGTLRLSTGSGTGGQAQVTGNHRFEMRADARTQFSGSCSGGVVLLEGRIDSGGRVTGYYRSRDLVCDGLAHELTGELTAARD